MSNPNLYVEIQSRTQSFVEEIASLVQRAAVESVGEVLQRELRLSTGARPSARPESVEAEHLRRLRRSPENLAADTERLYREIKARPGRRIEQIAAALGTSTRSLTLPIRRLIAERRVATSGRKRATRYYAASSVS